MKCALCGCEFDAKNADVACAACGMGKSCGLVRCPRCHYETPAVGGKTHKITAVSEEPCVFSLDRWPVGTRARIVRIKTDNRAALRKMIAMGVLPQAEIVIKRKFPSYVLEIGSGKFSMDRELTSLIFVRSL
ncbi:MAG: hypothetical protein AUJ71_01645 [Candidatus Omnitrophica bacterium CG1_02_49_16]|nr:MAG: hypothetical protein AUJ71_01645 [Candidatus Omnitrophica bacterium CG1_02_49_16]